LDYVAADSPPAAKRLLAHLDDIIERLAAGELSGPQVRLRGRGLAHRWSLPPYRLYYRRTRSALILLRFYHQARRSIEEH
jgi:plasmid stabilization system protein ParE